MLDVIYLSQSNQDKPWPVFQISEAELMLFEGAFTYLKEKTGVLIDPYGSCWVYPDHLVILINHLSLSSEAKVQEFVSFLHCAVKQNETLLFDGD